MKPGDLVKYASPVSTSGIKRDQLIGIVVETGPTFEDSPQSPLDIYEVDVYWTGIDVQRISLDSHQSNRWWAYIEDLVVISES